MDSLDAFLKIEMLQQELKDMQIVLELYADPNNWHNSYDIPYDSPPGEGFKLVWARQEDGWTEAARALGDIF